MNDEQRWPARFGAQPEGTGPFFRLPALQLTCVRQVHGDRCASAAEKLASVAATSMVLTGPKDQLADGLTGFQLPMGLGNRFQREAGDGRDD